MSKLFRFAGPLLLALIASPTTAQLRGAPPPASTIEWRVKDRFRLFDQASQGARDRVDTAMAAIASADRAAPLATYYDLLLDTLSDHDAASGHAAQLRRSHYTPAAESAGRTPGRYDPAYLYPDHYVLELRDPAGTGRNCVYASGISRSEGACDAWTPIAVPSGDGGRHFAGGSGIVRIESAGRPTRDWAYAFRDELVVALGDSFISGEGNPDRPSLIRADEPDKIFQRYSWGSRVELGKQLLRKAEWWDQACHRSLLSWPVLAGFAHAARDPHRAVTLVHLGCSGAVVGDIIQHGEADLPGGGDETESQLALLDGLLLRPSDDWKPRSVDRVLLSIGGNDIGFVGVLTTLTLPTNGFTLGAVAARTIGKEAGAICPYDYTDRFLKRLCITRDSAQTRIRKLPDAYKDLNEAFRRRDIDHDRVFHAQYPNPLIGTGNKPCDNNPADPAASGAPTNYGFEALMGVFPKMARGFRFKSWRFELLYGDDANGGNQPIYADMPLVKCDMTASPYDSEVCQALLVHKWLNDEVDKTPFRHISAHVLLTRGHGICVTGANRNLDPSLPYAVKRKWQGSKKLEWNGSKTPATFFPYERAEDGRWFRLPNDSILTQFDIYNGERRFHQGTVHPTYRAHLEYAQAALDTAFAK